MRKRPLQSEVQEFIVNELGISPDANYEVIPVEGPKGFEFYMIAFRSLHRQEDGMWQEDVSISVFWPKNEKAPTADEQLRLL